MLVKMRLAMAAGRYPVGGPLEMADQTTLQERLLQAEEHLDKGIKTITRQRQIIDALREDGLDTSEAEALLVQLEEIQTLYVAKRDQIAAEIKAAENSTRS